MVCSRPVLSTMTLFLLISPSLTMNVFTVGFWVTYISTGFMESSVGGELYRFEHVREAVGRDLQAIAHHDLQILKAAESGKGDKAGERRQWPC